jgi:hypothetical protein
MKKHCLFSVFSLLLLTHFPQAQTTKTPHSGIETAPARYSHLLIVNGKPARLVNEANISPFRSLYLQRPVEISERGMPAWRSNNFIRSAGLNSNIISGPFGEGGTISTNLSVTSTCIGGSFVIDYLTANAIFNAGNIFIAQLSDVFGSFTTPVEIGSIVSTAGTGSISVTIPSNTVPGADYKIRVVSSDPFITGSSSSSFSVNSTNTWTGAVNSAWENPGNWGCGTVPNANTDVVINSGTVVINSNAECRSLNLGSTVTLTINQSILGSH